MTVPPNPKITTGGLPASRKIHVNGTLHPPDVRVPMREISVHPPTAGEPPPLPVYDSSGPYTDPPEVVTDIKLGLAPPLRRAWILARGDVEEYEGREIKPEDNGFVEGDKLTPPEFPVKPPRPPLRAKDGRAVTQLAYARAGIITPEMEFIAIRENQLRELAPPCHGQPPRDGNDWGARISRTT